MKREFVRLATFFLMLLRASCALAAPPSDASLRDLFETTRARESLEQRINAYQQSMGSMVDQNISQQNLPDDAKRKLRAQADKLVEGLIERLKEKVGWDAMQAFYTELYKRHFSEEEVQEFLKFYKSAAGQSFLTKMPQITQETIAATQQAMLPLLDETTVQIDKQMAREIIRFSKHPKPSSD